MDANGKLNPTERFENMLAVMDYTMDKLDDGSYAVWDTQTRNYVQVDSEDGKFEKASDVTDRLWNAIEEQIVENFRDGVEEVLASINPEVYRDYTPPEEIPADVKALDELLLTDQVLREQMIEQGWESDIGYIELLSRQLDDVSFARMFDEKYFDRVFVDENDEDAVLVENGNMNVHLAAYDDVYTELLRNSEYELGEQTEDVRYGNYPVDFEQLKDETGYEYADLYVDFDLNGKEDPAYTLIVTAGDDKQTFTDFEPKFGESSGRLKVPDEIKAAVVHAVEQHYEKPLDEVLQDCKKADKEIE